MMKITLAQLNPIIGDITYNLSLIKTTCQKASKDKSDLIIFPELTLVGYPPRDLLTTSWFYKAVLDGLEEILSFSKSYPNLGILVGAPFKDQQNGKMFNSAHLIENGKLLFTQHKTLLPTYDVFDETRYFASNQAPEVFTYKGEKLGVSLCEDAWYHEDAKRYAVDPIKLLADKGATLLINLMASPFEKGKNVFRENLFKKHSAAFGIPFIAVNQVGGQDELVFDGGSFVCNQTDIVHRCNYFTDDSKTVDLNDLTTPIQELHPDQELEHCYQALVLGLRDYVKKCGFSKVHLGLSGGIDSALTAVIAVDALGADNVKGILMPSPYSSQGSIDDAQLLASNLGIISEVISISDSFSSLKNTLTPFYKAHANLDLSQEVSSLSLENLQARIRGSILMAISNEINSLLLSTGNKSEMAVGYCTLYGDMNGGLSVLSDVPKTLVYELANWVNKDHVRIPQNSISKPPSAELRPDQKDQDSLPDYEVLDAIIYAYIELGKSSAAMVSEGFDQAVVNWVIKAIKQNEYKRRQAAPGLKITSKAFGTGRRFPLAARYTS